MFTTIEFQQAVARDREREVKRLLAARAAEKTLAKGARRPQPRSPWRVLFPGPAGPATARSTSN